MSDVSKTNVSKENEIVIYAKIGNAEGLKFATEKEEHTQLEATLNSGNRCRVRKVLKNDSIKYFYTLKVKQEGKESNISSSTEYNTEVDEDFCKGFNQVADKVIYKNRYIFLKNIKITIDDKIIEIENVKHEVDLFKRFDSYTKQNITSDWCKIDIEIDAINKYIEDNYPDREDVKFTISITDLPFEPMTPIMSSTATEEQKDKLNQLWKEEFSISLVN